MKIYGFLTSVFISSLAHAELIRPLPLAPEDEASTKFTLQVDGKEVPVAFGNFNGEKSFHHASFEMKGKTELKVTINGATSKLVVRPTRHQLASGDGQTTFSITEPLKLVVETKGERPFFIFALPPEENVPSPNDPNVIYFGPGLHEPGAIRPKSGQTVYLAAGAKVKGTIYTFEADGVTVRGRGVLDAQKKTSAAKKIHALLFERSKNLKLEGIQVRAGNWWQCHFHLSDHIRVDHVQMMSFGVNNDGIDIDGVTDIAVRDSFIGCGDDGFGWHAIDAVAYGEPPTRDCLAERCVIWNEHAGNGLRLGASLETKVFENITFRDIDVLHVRGNGFAIMADHSDWAHLRNVLFERFHNESDQRLMDLKIGKTIYTNNTGYRDERGTISDFYFHQVTSVRPGIKLEGASPEHTISDLWFVECTQAGNPLKIVKTGPYVKGINFADKLPDRKVYPIEKIETRSPDSLLIDDGDEGFASFGGKELEKLSQVPGAENGDAQRFKILGAAHAAAYSPKLSGKYEISVHWGEHTDLGTKSPWTVHHTTGYTTKVFNQNRSAGWHSLGEFELDGESWVRLADPHYRISNGAVVADAVRFTKVK